MKTKASYPGIDYFRIVAAVLVVAIHTSPLSEVSETADFILTRVLARVAVPFFFMASGFFLFSDTETARPRPAQFLKKTAIIYAIAIALYLPLNIYAGTTSDWLFPPNLLKDIFFDGTFYHLWYLPAAIIGAAIAWILLNKLKARQALGVGLFLYVIGLFGDSYYGIAEKAPFLKALYQVLFVFSDYTRNGLFFAPVFFLLGALTARQPKRYGLKGCLTGLAICFVLMLGEGLLIRGFDIQRHDSMYIMLLPCMVFLFRSLLFLTGKNHKNLRDLSLCIYLVHPLMIVLVRGFAKFTDTQRLLVDNSLVHFIAVAGASFAAAILLTKLLRVKHTGKTASAQGRMDRAWVEINMPNLRHNAQVLRAALPDGCEMMAVVKANAYGHGDIEVSICLSRMGVRSFAVATIDEGIRLRRKGIKGEILVLGYTAPRRASELRRYCLSQTVIDAEYAKSLNSFGKAIRVHIKVDTGMHRLGESCSHVDEIAHIFSYKNLKINGIYTHLCAADSMEPKDTAFTREQIQRFNRLLDELKEQKIQLPKIHIQSSYGVLNYPELQCDYARIGIALYGVLSAPDTPTKLSLDLQPVLALKSEIVLIRTIATGESVGYGCEFVVQEETKIAVIPIGYADGLPRSLSNANSYSLIRGCRAPMIGRICMDQLMVDITGLSNVQKGDVVTLIGKDGAEEISAEQTAVDAGTITNELLCRLSTRLERVFRYS